jgi:hypothetical protein
MSRTSSACYLVEPKLAGRRISGAVKATEMEFPFLQKLYEGILALEKSALQHSAILKYRVNDFRGSSGESSEMSIYS